MATPNDESPIHHRFVQVRTSSAWYTWLMNTAKHFDMSKTLLIERALDHYTRARRYAVRPPKRTTHS